MTSRDFCYWLQGYLELANEADEPKPLTPKQMQAISNHLGLVFKHEIDPSMGPPAHQADLDAIHNASKEKLKSLEKKVAAIQNRPDGPLVMRC